MKLERSFAIKVGITAISIFLAIVLLSFNYSVVFMVNVKILNNFIYFLDL